MMCKYFGVSARDMEGDAWKGMICTTREYLEATQRGKEMRATNPMAVAAYYNRKAKRVVVSLSTKIEVMFNPSDVQGLENAKPSQLEEIEVTPSGFGLYFPELDEGINVLNLLEGTIGSRKWMASRLGAQGGKSPHPSQGRRLSRERCPRWPSPQNCP